MTGSGSRLERARERLAALAPGLADGRLEVAELEVRETQEGPALAGVATVGGLPTRAVEELAALGLHDRVRRLPDAALPENERRAVVVASWVPARRAPSHRAEMVTQWLCGEVLEVLERRGAWRRARGPDGYLGWTAGGGTAAVSPQEAERWSSLARAVALGTRVLGAGEASGARVIPWGGRVAAEANGEVRLPDGARARPLEPEAIVPGERQSVLFPRDGAAVIRTAARWIGAPYVWGGRTPWGTDCSGFVQAVFGLHGVGLPRDSDLQRAAGPDVPLGCAEERDLLPGDLLFFAPAGGPVSHVGIAAGGSRILHCSETNGMVALDDLRGSRTAERELRASLAAATRPVAAAAQPLAAG